MTNAEFRIAYPNFAKTVSVPDAVLDPALADAARMTDAATWGALYDKAHGLLTAHILSMGPSGREARFKAIDSRTVYLVERERLEVLVAAGWGVTP